MTKKPKPNMRLIARNRRARYDYQIIDIWEAGIRLNGLEVKGLRDGNASIAEAWVKLSNNKVLLVGSNIQSKQVAAWQSYEPDRDRILLLHKSEIKKLKAATLKGFTIIPLQLYFNKRGLAKIQIATAKGRKKYDKRQAMKERDIKRLGY